MRSEPWLSYDSPPAGRRSPHDNGGRRRVGRVVAGVVLIVAVAAGVAVAWPGKDTDPPSLTAAQGSPAAVAAPPGTAPAPTGVVVAPAPAVTPGQRVPPVPVPASTPAGSPAGPARPLAGRVVVLDPGHNPGNGRHTSEINQKVDAGGLRKECDTTGTETNAGYTEAAFTLDVAERARRMLAELGADVRFTWQQPRAWGPCVDERARAGNEAGAHAVVSIHGDGGPATGRGYHVIAPALVKATGADTSKIVAPSKVLAQRIAARFGSSTATGPATYLGGGNGVVTRNDLGGLNLSTVPKVFIECGNMRNAVDARLMGTDTWRELAARGIVQGITDFLTGAVA